MKRLWYLLFAFPAVVTAQVSDATFQSETDRLYAAAVEECYGQTDSQPLVVEANVRVFDTLPEVLGDRAIEVLETSELVRRAGDGQVRIVVPLPIRVAGARLEVRLLNYYFSSPEPGALHYALEGGCSAQFVLTNGEYELLGIERGGV